MQKAGGIVAIIAGIFGVMAAGVTLLFGGLSSALQSKGASTVVALGWGGVAFSFLVIILGAIALTTQRKLIGVLLMAASIAGAILGGTLVAIFMVLALIGGLLATLGTHRRVVA